MVSNKQPADLRIFLGTIEIAGYYHSLAASFTDREVYCRQITLAPHPFKYAECSDSPCFVQWVRKISAKRYKTKGRSFVFWFSRGLLWGCESVIRIFLILPWATAKFDVFIFAANSKIVDARFGYWDIALLRLFRKRVIFVFHGSDSRPPYISGTVIHSLETNKSLVNIKELCKKTKKQKEGLRRIEKLAHVVVNNPVYGHFHEMPFVNIMHIGIPFMPAEEDARLTGKSLEKISNCVRILHAPSHRESKGSDIIQASVERLKEKKYQIDYIEIYNLPHSEVIREIQQCDFIIDQIYSDAPMAGFAAEAAYYGKPAIVCGYLPKNQWVEQIPTYYCHPRKLEASIELLINDGNFKKDLGRKAERFVKEQWSAAAVAERYHRIIEGDIPEKWWFDPKNITYLHGWGLPEAKLKETVSSYIRKHGLSALQLDDKPALRDRLLTLVQLP